RAAPGPWPPGASAAGRGAGERRVRASEPGPVVTLFFLGIALILAGGLAAALLRRRPALADRAFGVLVAGGCALGLVPAVAVLSGRDVAGVSVAVPMPGGPGAFGVDGPSALLLLFVLR